MFIPTRGGLDYGIPGWISNPHETSGLESTPTRDSNPLRVGFFPVSGCTKLEYSTCLKSKMLMTPTRSGLDSWEFWVGVLQCGDLGAVGPQKFFRILGNLKMVLHSPKQVPWSCFFRNVPFFLSEVILLILASGEEGDNFAAT